MKKVKMNNLLSAKSLTKSYKNISIISNVSFSITSGDIVGLLGPNGAGKSTIFKVLSGIIYPNSGNIFLNNNNITKLPIYDRAKLNISYLPQDSSVFRGLTVEENIIAIMQVLNYSKKNQKTELENILDKLNIKNIRHLKGLNLSGGERKKVEIARCLVINPIFILLDEPLAGIDPISIIEIKKIIIDLAGTGIGIFITDHNVREILSLCNKAYIINEGKIIYKGKSKDIISNKYVRELYLGNDFAN